MLTVRIKEFKAYYAKTIVLRNKLTEGFVEKNSTNWWLVSGTLLMELGLLCDFFVNFST